MNPQSIPSLFATRLGISVWALTESAVVTTCRNCLSKLSDETEIQELRNAEGNMICIKIEEVTQNRQQIAQDMKAKY